jgi:hypothetical protein
MGIFKLNNDELKILQVITWWQNEFVNATSNGKKTPYEFVHDNDNCYDPFKEALSGISWENIDFSILVSIGFIPVYKSVSGTKKFNGCYVIPEWFLRQMIDTYNMYEGGLPGVKIYKLNKRYDNLINLSHVVLTSKELYYEKYDMNEKLPNECVSLGKVDVWYNERVYANTSNAYMVKIKNPNYKTLEFNKTFYNLVSFVKDCIYAYHYMMKSKYEDYNPLKAAYRESSRIYADSAEFRSGALFKRKGFPDLPIDEELFSSLGFRGFDDAPVKAGYFCIPAYAFPYMSKELAVKSIDGETKSIENILEDHKKIGAFTPDTRFGCTAYMINIKNVKLNVAEKIEEEPEDNEI